MPVQFVKFQRGTQSAYDRLLRKDPETLYFIYNDPNDAEQGGKLYLGDRLIGGSSANNVTQLSDLSDLDLSALSTVQNPDGMILQYNNNTSKWEAQSIVTALENANVTPDVSSTTAASNQTPEQAAAAANVTPSEGDIVFVDGVPYIYNGSTWQNLNGSSLESTLNNLESRLSAVESGLQAVDGKISSAIASAQHLKYVIPQDGILPEIATASPGSLDNTIFLVPNNTADNEDNYDEYMFIKTSENDTGSFEKLGNWGVNLNNYVTTTDFDTRVGSLEDDFYELQSVVNSMNLNQFVTLTKYNSEVGNINTLRTATGDDTSDIISELLDVRDKLIWKPINEE